MKKIPNLLTFSIYIAGIVLGLALASLSAWADAEASFYGFTKQTKTPLQSLTCPVMMTKNESREIIIRFTNTTEKAISPVVRIEASTPLTSEFEQNRVNVAADETITLKKTIGTKNIDLNHFIFAKVLIFSTYPMDNQESTCGVFILPFNGNGTLILIILTSLSLLMTGAGAYLLWKSDISARKVNPFLFIAVLLLPALLFAFLGWWIQAILVLVVTLLTLVIGLGNLIH